MSFINVFVQTENSSEILTGRAAPIHSLGQFLETLDCPGAKQEGALLYLEDGYACLDDALRLEDLLPLCKDNNAFEPLRIHVSRCKKVEVEVRFNGQRATRSFLPGATIARVHHWAARRAFEMSACDAAEHVLQLHGSDTQPDRDVHIGSLTSCSECAVSFDLVPRKRVEG